MSVEQLEMLRKKARNGIIIGISCSIGISLLLFLITKLFPIIFFGIFGVIITIALTSKKQKEFSLAFKRTFVLKALELVFTDLKYLPENGISESVIRNTKMMNMGDRYSSNDYFYGKYKDISVVQADVHIEEKHTTTDSHGHTTTHWVTIFRGRWMVFDFNKSFVANIQVCQKGFSNAKVGNFGQDLKFKKIQLEDETFNNQFRTYAQNEHDAFYVLTPQFMEKIKNLINMVNGKMLLCFIDNKLHVGIQNNQDSFEHNVFTKIDEKQVIEQISRDIKLITNFVDELDLDNNLFRKEV